jgi:Uma2 family endonuclease
MVATLPDSGATLLTAAEFPALPESRKKDQFLIRGKLREKPRTFRNPFHSEFMTQLAFLLKRLIRSEETASFKIVCGEAGSRLRAEPSSIVGIDVAVVSTDVGHYVQRKRVVFDSAPILAIEILSPSNRVAEVRPKSRNTCLWV